MISVLLPQDRGTRISLFKRILARFGYSCSAHHDQSERRSSPGTPVVVSVPSATFDGEAQEGLKRMGIICR
jgi:hypothetical protein